MSKQQLLVVDDDAHMRGLIRAAFEGVGYTVREASVGEVAVELCRTQPPALVVLDVSLGPDSIDGFEACRRIRRFSDVPVVFLTAREEDIDQVAGLSIGADDYLTKPVAPRVLVAHAEAVLRRESGRMERDYGPVYETPGLRIDMQARTVTVANNAVVDLTGIQFDLLAALAERPNRVLTREQLIERAWGNWYGPDHHLDVHLSRLRARILDAGGPRVGCAVRGVGFRLRD